MKVCPYFEMAICFWDAILLLERYCNLLNSARLGNNMPPFLIIFVLFVNVVVFPFMRPLLQLVTNLFFHSSATEAAASAAFIMKAAEEVLHLRRESGASQVHCMPV